MKKKTNFFLQYSPYSHQVILVTVTFRPHVDATQNRFEELKEGYVL